MNVVAGGGIQIGNAVFSVNASGKLLFTGLPTADPRVAGQVWANSGVLTLSAG
jgi:hypothetical protein